MSITYLHKYNDTHIENNKKTVVEHAIFYGDKGLSMKCFTNDDGVTEKVSVMKKDNDTFVLKIAINKDTPTEKEVTRDQLMKELKDKKYKFITDFLKENKDKNMDQTKSLKRTQQKGSKKGSKKSSKKSSKKYKMNGGAHEQDEPDNVNEGTWLDDHQVGAGKKKPIKSGSKSGMKKGSKKGSKK